MEHLLKLYCALAGFKLINNQRGVTALEYSLIAAAVVVAVGAAMVALVPGLNTMLGSICSAMNVTCGTAPAGD